MLNEKAPEAALGSDSGQSAWQATSPYTETCENSMCSFVPDKEEAIRFLACLDPTATSFTFQTFDDNKARKASRLACVLHGTPVDHWDTLCRYNNQGAGIFVTVNETDGKRRKAGNIIRVRAIWQEQDQPDCPELPIEPNIVVESSPGKYHRYILVDGCPLEAFQGLQARMVMTYGSDPNAKDIARVLRLPGFFHQKDPGHPHMVRIVSKPDAPPLTYEQAKHSFPPVVRNFSDSQSVCDLPKDVNLEEIKSALEALDPDMEYDLWLKVLMAVHHATGGSMEGLQIVDNWSRQSEKYKEGGCEAKWKSFQSSGITIATLFALAKDAGWTESAEEWELPVSIDQVDLPKFSDQDFPSKLWAMIDAVAKATETPAELGASIALAITATCIQGKIHTEVKPGYYEPLNLWTCAIMLPGSRKSATLSEFTDPLYQWEKDQESSLKPIIEDAIYKREIEELRIKDLQRCYAKEKDVDKRKETLLCIEEARKCLPDIITVPRLLTQDITPEHLGTMMAVNKNKMAVISAEGGIFENLAGRYSRGTANLDLVLQAHSGDSVRIDRGSRPPVSMEKPALTMGLTVQPDVIQGLSNKPGFRGRGLIGRFLFVCPVDNVGRRTLQTEPIPAEIKTEYNELISALLKIPASDGTQIINLSSGAFEIWKGFQYEVEVSMAEGGAFNHMRDFAGKLPGAAARITGLFHCCENRIQPWRIKLEQKTMQQAINLARKLSLHTLHVFDSMGADDSVHAARKILKWIKRNGKASFTARECHAALKGSIPKRANLDPGLQELREHGYIRRVAPQGKKAGRPSEKFEVNPLTQE